MAFGKIVVKHESGERQIYDLDKMTTSVGRQAGNDIVLNTTAVSRYHAQFTVAEGRVYIVDLGGVNGTFVNDERMAPESQVELNEGDIVTLGDVSLTFFPREVRSDISLTPEVTVAEVEGVPFRMFVEDPLQPVSPGARLRLTVVVENLSDQEQMYSVAVSGMDRNWASVNRQQIRLEAFEKTEVVVSVRPPRNTQSRPGVYPLAIAVALKDDPTKAIEVMREIDVVGYSGFGMVMQQGDKAEVFHLATQNQGNVPLDIRLEGYQRQSLLEYHFDPPEVHLQPGETSQILLTLSAQGRAIETGERIPFAAVAHSLDPSGYQAPLYALYQPGRKPVPAKTSSAMMAGLLGLPLLIGGGLLMVLVIAGIIFLPKMLGNSGGSDAGDTTVIGDSEETSVGMVDTPTQIPSLVPSLQPSVTLAPLGGGGEATPTETPVVLDPEPKMFYTVLFKPDVEPFEKLIPLGRIYSIEFAPTGFPEGTDVTRWWVQVNDVQLDFTPKLEGERPLPSLSVPLWKIVELSGWLGDKVYTIHYSTPETEDEMLGVSVQLNIIPQRCNITMDDTQYYALPGETQTLEPYITEDIFVVGWLELNGIRWLRVAPDDATKGSSALSLVNQRWIALKPPAGADVEIFPGMTEVYCSGQFIRVNEFAPSPLEQVGTDNANDEIGGALTKP